MMGPPYSSDGHRPQQESPPLMTSSGTCTPTSNSHNMQPGPQAPPPHTTTHHHFQQQIQQPNNHQILSNSSQIHQQRPPWPSTSTASYLVKPKATHPQMMSSVNSGPGQHTTSAAYPNNGLRESPDEGIQDDVATDV